MLQTRKLRNISLFKIRERYGRLQGKKLSASQEGSILVGIIITMVVMATLGAGMIYFTTTSTFQELLANNHARAYYAAESGGRYANALIRQTLAKGSQAEFDALTTNISNTTYTMANNDQFQITYWTPEYLPVTGGVTVRVTYDSIGTVGSGFLQAKVRLRYHINPANQGSGPGGAGGTGNGDIPPPQPALPRPASDFDIPKQDLDIYYSPVDMSQVDIKDNPFVDSDRALNLKADYYIMGLKWYANPEQMLQLDQIRTTNGGLLSYRAQVKIKVNNDRTDEFNKYNIIGISFRLDDTATDLMTSNIAYPDTYGISFVKLPGPWESNINAARYKNAPAWYKQVIHEESSWNNVSDDNWHVVLWKRAAGESGLHKALAYRRLTTADWVCSSGTGTSCLTIKDWSTIYVDVEEKFGSADDVYGFTDSTVRYNVITAYLQGGSVINSLPPSPPGPYVRSTIASPQDIWWEDYPENPKFQPASWTLATTSVPMLGPFLGTPTNTIADASLSTLNYSSYTPLTTTKAREVGLHIYNIKTNAQTVFYDNFYIDLSPSSPPGSSGGGFMDGTGGLEMGP